jgi:hypothetical protein
LLFFFQRESKELIHLMEGVATNLAIDTVMNNLKKTDAVRCVAHLFGDRRTSLRRATPPIAEVENWNCAFHTLKGIAYDRLRRNTEMASAIPAAKFCLHSNDVRCNASSGFFMFPHSIITLGTVERLSPARSLRG